MRLKKITAVALMAALTFLFLAQPRSLSGGLPVFDYLRFTQEAADHLAKMLKMTKVIELIRTVKQIEEDMRYFYKQIYSVMHESELISVKELLWQILDSTYLRDVQQNDPWWIIWNTDVALQELFPELSDYSYITDTYFYKHNPEHREYADKIIAYQQEKLQELENLKEHLKLMRKAYEKNILQVNLFSNRLVEFSQANQVGKLIALIANLELMNARLNLTLNFNRRVMMTFNLKKDTWQMVNENREMERDTWGIKE